MRHIKSLLIALAFIAGGVLPAWATFVFIGGEDIDVTLIGNSTVDTNSAHFRSAYAREGISVAGTNFSGNSQDPPTNRFYVPAFSNQTTLWVHAIVFTAGDTTNIGPQAGEAIALISPDGFPRLLINGSLSNNAQVTIATRNSAATITVLTTCILGAWPVFNSRNQLDWFVNYAVSGQTALYINGVQICSYSGNLTTDGTTALNDAFFANPAARGTLSSAVWSEMLISTTDTRSLNLFTCAPQANGNTMAWTGSYTNVNPTAINDASFISTTSNNQIAEFTCPSLPAGTWAIPSVSQSIRALSGATGPQTYDFILRPATGSTNYNVCAGTVPGSAFNNNYCQTVLNPACSCAWTPSDWGTGANAGLESKP